MADNKPKFQTAAGRASAAEASYERKQRLLAIGAVVLIVCCGVYLTLSFSGAMGGGSHVIEPSPEAIEAARPIKEDYKAMEEMTLAELEQEVASRRAKAQAAIRGNPNEIAETQQALDRCEEILSAKRAEAERAQGGS